MKFDYKKRKERIMKKILLLLVAISLVTVFSLAGCKEAVSEDTGEVVEEESATEEEASEEGATEDMGTVVMISKVYAHPWYQIAYKGAEEACAEYGFTLETDGPSSASDIQVQVDQVNNAIDRKPAGVLLAAIDPASLTDALNKAGETSIPVICFDAGVPGNENVIATIATDNVQAGALAADELFKDADFQEAVLKGTEDNPVVIGALAEDGTSGSLVDRMDGFVFQLAENLETLDGMEDAVEVTGETQWAKESEKPAKVNIITAVPPTATAADSQAAVSAILQKTNLVAIYVCSTTVNTGLLTSTSDGLELDREDGEYKDLYAVAFDAGKATKEAVRDRKFFGAVTQDPYFIGYNAVKMLYDYLNGETPEDNYQDARWYNADNMDDEEIARLLYD